MQDIVLGLISIIIFLLVQKTSACETKTPKITTEESSTGYVEESTVPVEDFYVPNNTIEIEKDIFEIYESNVDDKRGKLAKSLHELSKYMDMDEFFDRHEYILEYIFDRTIS
jgi:hypothetical protein